MSRVAHAQNFNISNERTLEKKFNIQVDTSSSFHTSIQPYTQNELNEIYNYDSTLSLLKITSSSGAVNQLMNNHQMEFKKEHFYFSLDPIINVGMTQEKSNLLSQNLVETSVGLNTKTALGKKWSGQFLFLMDKSEYPSYIDQIVQTKNISPGYGYSKNNQSIFSQGDITFTADKNFAFQAGYGKHFIGDGYRSLFLSDHANSYPYLKVTANIWKLKYMALYTNFQDIRESNGEANNYFQKLSSIHYLSLNITKWWNIGFFESIVWQAQEGAFYRGYDINYLNPVIFLRPTEYAQGSGDNALLGGSMKFKIKKKNILYSQVILDEFLLQEIKAGNDWWANKYGIQLGLKAYDFLWLKNLRLQMEYNMVRPFTYTHSYHPTSISTLQNYAHFNAPLAHPLGANFQEVMTGLSYHKKRWVFEATSTFAKIGLDTNNTTSVGQDIFIPNNDRPLNSSTGKEIDYGYVVGGGLSTNIVNSTLKITYIINPKSRFTITGGVSNRRYKNNLSDLSTNYFFIGLKTNLINRYFDY
ncbi:MAG: hypothetical protein J5I47_09095 [Vicingus serpentipes]|nr:hypothetical protein [Vicingus serpentipes]